MDTLKKLNVTVSGSEGPAIIMAHGYGCDQNMWRLIAKEFARDYKIVLFDYVGAGKSDISQYNTAKYSTLSGYADDVLEICETLNLKETIFFGHSVSAMIGVLAAIKKPERFSRLILVAPSPCYLNDGPYEGGFSGEAIDGLIDTLKSNYMGWSSTMAPIIMGNAERPELAAELESSFCRTDPKIAASFANVTFRSDNRKDLNLVSTPSLILQCSNDAIAPAFVGEYLKKHLKNSTFHQLKATGHCPHLSAPDETAAAIKLYLKTTIAHK